MRCEGDIMLSCDGAMITLSTNIVNTVKILRHIA